MDRQDDSRQPHPQPLVSVVIATHDRPALLRRALDAVADQDYTGPIEVVVVFDGQPVDESIVSDRPARTVRAVPNTHSPGLVGARNSGIETTVGEYVAFCDDDDEWFPGKLTAQVDKASEGYDTVVTGIVIDYEGRESVRVPSDADVSLPELIRRRVMEAHPSTVLVGRSALVGRIGEVDEQIPGSYAEDYDWILRAAKSGTIGVVSRPLVRVHWGQSLFSRKWRTIIDALDYLIAKHPEFQASPEGMARILGQQAFALAALSEGREARAVARQAIALNRQEKRAYLAVAVSYRLISAQRVMDLANRAGRGI